jgi:SAM-dependent methyltransferase
MRRVDYDEVAATYNQRYGRNRFDGILDALHRFIGDGQHADVVEIGCGTGRWLAELANRVRSIIGVDVSRGMLRVAAADTRSPLLVQARAEEIPLASVSVDRVFCINALHHFTDRVAFAREARRILRSRGTLMVVGLDPHTTLDRWWIYDYFPGTLAADLVRYPSAEAIRATLKDAGFSDLTTSVAQHIPAAVPFDLAVERGYVDRRSTSQLMVISDAEYEEGVRRLTAERPVLRADLRLYATIGRVVGKR